MQKSGKEESLRDSDVKRFYEKRPQRAARANGASKKSTKNQKKYKG